MEFAASGESEIQYSSLKLSKFDVYQLDLMEQAGFVEIKGKERTHTTFRPGSHFQDCFSVRLDPRFSVTWAGHDYLDAVQNENIWRQTSEVVAKEGGGITLELVKAIAVGFAKKQIEERTGLKI